MVILKEIWENIKGFEGVYQVSNLGNIKSLDRIVEKKIGGKKVYQHLKGNILRQKENHQNHYLYVELCKNGIQKTFSVHRLVAKTFLPNQKNLPFINHKDENRHNNNVNNLEWCTAKYNHDYGTRTLREALTKSKPVVQMDLEGNIISVYPNAIVAAKATGANRKAIQMIAKHYSCNGKKYLTSNGYKWEYLKRRLET